MYQSGADDPSWGDIGMWYERHSLKVNCHTIQCFHVDFLRSKIAARRPEAAAPANELQASGALFCSSSLRLRNPCSDRRRTISHLPKSFLSRRTKSTSGFENRSRKCDKKTRLPNGRHKQWKMHGNQSRPAELHQSIFPDDCSKPRDLLGLVV